MKLFNLLSFVSGLLPMATMCMVAVVNFLANTTVS